MIFAGRVPVIIAVILISMNMLYFHHHMDDGHDIEIPVIENVQMEDEFHTTRSGGKQLEMPRTGLYMEPGDTSWISESDNIESVNGEYIQIDEKVLTGRSRFESSVYTAYRSLNSRSIQEYKGILFMSYVTYESSPSDSYHCWLAASFDQGETWSSREVFSRSGLDSASVDLLVYQDKIFYLAKYFSQSANLRLSHIKVTPYLNWRNISGVQYKEIIPDKRMDTSSLVGHGDRVMLFWKGTDSRPYYMIYLNNSWSGQIGILPSVKFYCPISSALKGAPILYLFYTSSPSPDILMINSTDGGVTWGSPVRIGNSGGDLTYMVGVSSGEIVHLAVTKEDENSIRYVRYDPGSPFHYSDIAVYALNGLDGDDKELSISTDGRRIAVSFEDSTGTISIIKSYDGGSTFTGRSKIGSGSAHCPSMDRDHRYMMFINGSDVEVLAWSESDSGMIRTGVISPAGVVSWDQYAFSVGGVADPYSFGFRVISPDGSIQYYPDAGYKHLDGLSDGNLSSLYFGHIGNFDGSFSSGSGLADDIVIEMRFLKSNEDNPLLFGLFINFTVSYPYREDYYGGYHVVDLDNCFISSVGIELEDGETSGEAILGPYYIEDMPPDHLSIRCSFVNDENYVQASILGYEYRPIFGFDNSNCTKITQPDKESFFLWKDKALGNIYDSFQEFHIKIEIHSQNAVSPKINWIKLGDSSPPEIMDISLEKEIVLRGEWSDIGIILFDKEDPVYNLDLMLECYDPVDEEWTRSHNSDPIFKDEQWKIKFITDYRTNVGTFRMRMKSTDSTGHTLGLVELDEVIEVVNNRPMPPYLTIIPETPTSGEYLSISALNEGSDLENQISSLTYRVRIFIDGEPELDVDNLTHLDIDINDRSMQKGEFWEVFAETWDGYDFSDPYYISWIVNNTPPTHSNVPVLRLHEDQDPMLLPLDDWIQDIDGDDLSYSLYPSPELLIEQISGNYYIRPVPDFNGKSYLKCTATDGIYDDEINLSVVITPENDQPIWNEPGVMVFSEGDTAFIRIDAADIKDDEMIDVEMDIESVIPGVVKGTNFFRYPNGSCYLKTDNRMVGRHDIQFTVSDSELSFTSNFTLEIINVNQPPAKPSVSISGEKSMFIQGEIISMSASSTDPDMIWGDKLNYSWHSDLSGELGVGNDVSVLLEPGAHTIEVVVFDTGGFQNSTYVDIVVMESADEGNPSIRTWQLLTLIGVISLILGIIASIILHLLVKSIVKGKAADSREDKEMTDESLSRGRSLEPPRVTGLPPHPSQSTSTLTPLPSRPELPPGGMQSLRSSVPNPVDGTHSSFASGIESNESVLPGGDLHA